MPYVKLYQICNLFSQEQRAAAHPLLPKQTHISLEVSA